MCEAVCDVGGVTVSKAVKLSVLPSDAEEEEDIDFLETRRYCTCRACAGGNGRWGH